jgi:hypothetical protein
VKMSALSTLDPRRMTVVQHPGQDLGDLDRSARASAGDPVEPDRHRGLHQCPGQRRPDPTAVRPDEEQLLAPDLLLGQPGVLTVADLGGQPVDGLAGGQGPATTRPARRDPGADLVVQLNPRTLDHGQQVPDRQRGPR